MAVQPVPCPKVVRPAKNASARVAKAMNRLRKSADLRRSGSCKPKFLAIVIFIESAKRLFDRREAQFAQIHGAGAERLTLFRWLSDLIQTQPNGYIDGLL